MPYSIMDEFDDLFGPADNAEVKPASEVPDDGTQIAFDPSEELLNEDL